MTCFSPRAFTTICRPVSVMSFASGMGPSPCSHRGIPSWPCPPHFSTSYPVRPLLFPMPTSCLAPMRKTGCSSKKPPGVRYPALRWTTSPQRCSLSPWAKESALPPDMQKTCFRRNPLPSASPTVTAASMNTSTITKQATARQSCSLRNFKERLRSNAASKIINLSIREIKSLSAPAG